MSSPGSQLQDCASTMKNLLSIWTSLDEKVISDLKDLHKNLGENLKECDERLEMELADIIVDILDEKSPLTTKEIGSRISKKNGQRPVRKKINACLYHNPALFRSDGDTIPKWATYEAE